MGFLYKSDHRCKLPRGVGRKAKKLAGSVWRCNTCGQHYRAHLRDTAARTHLSWHRITEVHARKILREQSNGMEARSVRVSKLQVPVRGMHL